MAQRNENEFLIHKCLTHTNKQLNLEDTLPTLLNCYGRAAYMFNHEGFLPIHLACIYHPTNLKVVDLIIKANPSGVVKPVSVSSFLYDI